MTAYSVIAVQPHTSLISTPDTVDLSVRSPSHFNPGERAGDSHLVRVERASQPDWRFEKKKIVFALLEIEPQFSVFRSVA